MLILQDIPPDPKRRTVAQGRVDRSPGTSMDPSLPRGSGSPAAHVCAGDDNVGIWAHYSLSLITWATVRFSREPPHPFFPVPQAQVCGCRSSWNKASAKRVFLCRRVSRRTEIGPPVEGCSLFPPRQCSDGWRHLSGEHSGLHRSSRVTDQAT